MSSTVPVSTKLPEPVPATVTVPSVVAVKVPVGTLNVTDTLPVAASGSAMLKPVRFKAVSSSVVKVAGNVLVGAVLTAFTVTFTVAVSVTSPEVTV